MKVFLPELAVGEFDGFTVQNDLFNRKPIADGLSHLVANASDPLVIALDAQWGAGKTVFLKQWAGELRNAGFPVIFFDAFANDFAEDAFAAIAGQVIALLEERNAADATTAERFKAQAWSLTKVLARSGLRAGIKIATMNVVDTKKLEEAAKIVGEELSRLEDENLGVLLTRQREHKATVEAFAAALSELPSAFKGPGEMRPLIFIIDELDRCKPAYALELLERIKHFFSVQNVHFVLGVHLHQLENSVVAAYGSGIDANTYLQKFIQLTVTLRDTAEADHDRVTPKYVAHLAKSLELAPEVREHLYLISHVAKVKHLSLRTLERIMTRLALATAFIPKNKLIPLQLVVPLVILKVLHPDIYEKARLEALQWDEIRVPLGFPFPVDAPYRNKMEWSRKWLTFATGGPLQDNELQQITEGLYRYNFESGQALTAWIANQVVERLEPMTS